MPQNLIPSLITPGKFFSIGVSKPQRGPAYVFATEGEVERRDDGSVSSFGYEWPGCRQHRVNLNGNNTKGNRLNALKQLLTDMQENGWISSDVAAENIGKDFK